jgi:WD40 repeat protein
VPLGEPSLASCVAFSPDGKWLASGHVSGELALWELGTRRQVLSWPAHQSRISRILALAFSLDGKWLASGGEDDVIALWETGTTNCLDQLTGPGGAIQCLTFSRDGRQLASANSDNTARIWDLPLRHALAETKALKLPANARLVCPSADGAGLYTLDLSSNAVSLWNGRSGQVVGTYSSNSFQPAEGGSLAYFLKPRLAVGFGTNGVLRIWDMTLCPEAIGLRRQPAPFPPTAKR